MAATPAKPNAREAIPPRTLSGRPVKAVYGPEDLAGFDPDVALGGPGEFPFTRGPHREMYREKLWTMRQFAGFGTPAQTNERFHYLLGQGQMGLSTAFDLPTLMGRDSDDPLSRGEVGRCGVAIDTLADFERLYEGIDLGEIHSPRPASRDLPERHSQGVPRPERIRLSAAAVSQARRGHHPVRDRTASAI